MCTSKILGGLGLRDPKESNEIMGETIWWRWIKYEDHPLVHMWHAKYAKEWDCPKPHTPHGR